MEKRDTDIPGLFSPLQIGRMALRNRLAVAPMTRVSASADGHATARMRDYYGAFAHGGFALVITEGIYTDQAFSQGYLHQPGLALARKYTGLPVIANGSLHELRRAQALIDGGEADMVSLGRGALTHADWPLRVQAGLPIEDFDRAILAPIADLANADRLKAQGLKAQAPALDR